MAHLSDPKRTKLSAQRKEKRAADKREKAFNRGVLDVLDGKVTMRRVRRRNDGRDITDTVTALRSEITTKPFSKHDDGANQAMSATLPAPARIWALDQALSQSNRFTDYDLVRPDLQKIGGLRRLPGDLEANIAGCAAFQDPPANVRRSAIAVWGDGGPHKINAAGLTVPPLMKDSLKKTKDGQEYYSSTTSVYVSTVRRAAVTAAHRHEDRVVLALEFGTGKLTEHLQASGTWDYLMKKYAN